MISAERILEELPKSLRSIELEGFGQKRSGKVRDFYFVDDKRVIVTTDRLSAFDVILGNIPYRGSVLNLLASFWFEKTKDIIKNHVISIPDPNVTIGRNCKPIPVEMVVRGYMTGVTNTSIWSSYKKGERDIYGIKFPEGMKKNQKLDKPVITPTTHPQAGSDKHDERLTREEIIDNGLVEEGLYKQMEIVALKLFDFGSKLCAKSGIILVDTKYEFGLYKDKLMLIDEIHTPDSSRFWLDKSYEERLGRDEEPENYDKEFLRIWYAERGYTGDGIPPKMSEDLIVKTANRYIDIYERLTGQRFENYHYPIEERIKTNLSSFLETSI